MAIRWFHFMLFLSAIQASANSKWLCAQDKWTEQAIRFPVEMGEFEIRVIDVDGNPIQDAEVQANGLRCMEDPGSWYAWPAANAGPVPNVETNATGHAKFAYPTKFGMPGEYRLVTILTLNIRHADFIAERVEVPIGEEGFEQRLKQGCRVTYSAVDEAGNPIEKFGAFISGPGYDAKWNLADGTIQSSAVPDGAWQTMLVAPREDGVTLFSGVLPARYASGRDVTIRNINLRPGLRVQGRLADNVPRPVTEGIVVAWSQPKPEEGALERREAIGWCDSATIQADGSFEFASLPSGGRLQLIAVCREWVITDHMRDGKPLQFGGRIKIGILIDLESADIRDNLLTDVVLPMETTGAIEVTIKHLDGSPAKGIYVGASPNQMLEDMGTQLLGEAYRSITAIESRLDGTSLPNYWQQGPRKSRYSQETDTDGKATLYDLPLGTWDVYVYSEEFALVPENRVQDRRFPAVSATVDKAQTTSIQATVQPITE